LPAKTRVYGYIVPALALGWIFATGPTRAQLELDCAHPAEARTLLGRLRLAEIEGAEDIHRAAMWDAFGRCPAAAAGEPCRTEERRRFEAQWDEQKRRIEDKYRDLLGEFEQRCRPVISLR
jgi:hypothetical protein